MIEIKVWSNGANRCRLVNRYEVEAVPRVGEEIRYEDIRTIGAPGFPPEICNGTITIILWDMPNKTVAVFVEDQ